MNSDPNNSASGNSRGDSNRNGVNPAAEEPRVVPATHQAPFFHENRNTINNLRRSASSPSPNAGAEGAAHQANGHSLKRTGPR